MNPTAWFWTVILAPIIGSFSCSYRDEGRGAGLDHLRALLLRLVRRFARPLSALCATIGLFYPFVELAAVAIAVWAVTVLSGWVLRASCVLGWTLLALAVIDYKHYVPSDFRSQNCHIK